MIFQELRQEAKVKVTWKQYVTQCNSRCIHTPNLGIMPEIIEDMLQTQLFACGALAASICVGIVIPSTWFVYLYNILLA